MQKEVREKRQKHFKLVDKHNLIKVDQKCFEVSSVEPDTIVSAETRMGELVRVFDPNGVRVQFRKVGAEEWQM